ncbi:aminotransferase class III-fold pyridoxal phosphate-dependent enzyme [Dactylosporangium sp. NPDC050688]|uniref:aminotransferase family protein n=1 Tax=Dactylosporangium sp. NPDC050688 TaxID=3157217 RepID=UPI0033D54A82
MPASVLPVVQRAHGVMIHDVDGRDYLDGCSGTVCVNIGHGVPEVLDAMASQARRVTFAHRSQFRNEPLTDLSATILSLAGEGFEEVVYTNSGSEAMETALRLMTHHHAGSARRVVVTQRPSYHGMTAGALAISAHPPRRANLESMLHGVGEVVHVESSDTAEIFPSLEDWMRVLNRFDPGEVAAVCFEPVGGAAGGGAEVSTETQRGLREFCDSSGALMIVDEVMTGFGRTGEWFGFTPSGVTPDLIVTGKGLSAGYIPIGACIVAATVLPGRSANDFSLGHTMSGNPLSAATALAVLNYTIDNKLVECARERGRRLRDELTALARDVDFLRPPRGRGLLLGAPIDQDPAGYATAPLNLLFTANARQCGLLVYPSGVDAHTQSVLVCPPLTISDAELDVLIARLADAARRTSQARTR